MTDQKTVLREEARRHLARIDVRDEDIDAAAVHFFSSLEIPKDKIIAAYWPVKREFDCYPILERALAEGYVCALPVVQPETRVLRFVRWDEHVKMEKGAFGIPEPQSDEIVEPDIVVVPMLAFDRKGYRMGQGGGYYDATLEDLRARKDIVAVGVAYTQQACLFNLPLEAHDQKMDWIVTPQGAQSF